MSDLVLPRPTEKGARQYINEEAFVPKRKAPFARLCVYRSFDDFPLDYPSAIDLKILRSISQRAKQHAKPDVSQAIDNAQVMEKVARRPRYLVVAFAVGLIISAIGAVLMIPSLFLHAGIINTISTLLLAVGSATVVIALLRGQDLDERAR